MLPNEVDALKLARGDVLSVTWVDIFEDSGGNPDEAELVTRLSVGLFWKVKESHGVPSLITTTTVDKDAPFQNGYCIYPLSCVLKIGIIKRSRKKQDGVQRRRIAKKNDTPNPTRSASGGRDLQEADAPPSGDKRS